MRLKTKDTSEIISEITEEELICWQQKIAQRVYNIKLTRNLYEKFTLNYDKGEFKEYGYEFAW